MKKIAICFNENGSEIIKRIKRESIKREIVPPDAYVKSESFIPKDDFIRIETSLAEWTASMFQPGNALIFVGAVGIAVRAISGLPADKLKDCPVIVIDDCSRFVIPVLSGHAGGANKLSMVLADILGAVPVITTSTDVNEAFSIDSYAMEKRLKIVNKEGIKKVSAKALEGRKVTLSIKDFPPKERVDVIVADDTDREYSLLLKPRKYTVGIGMKKGKDPDELEKFFLGTLSDNGIGTEDIYSLCTIDLKEDEPALLKLRDKYRIPVISFDKDILNKAEGDFDGSEFVKKTVGVDNVCERAAIVCAGPGSELVVRKTSRDGMTLSIARRVASGNLLL